MMQKILFGDTIDIEDVPQNEIIVDKKQEENKNTNNKTTNKVNTTPYYIKVNYGAQVVTIYKKDSDGNYTVPAKAMVCSTGIATPTSGVYKIPARWEWLHLQGDVWGHYSTQIKGNILFHSVPYLRKGELDSLEYWEYDKLGTAASAGCVRLIVEDAKWIFDNCKNGTPVEFYSSSNPGPLGKPSAQKISGNEHCRNWDPTDPNPNNPWKTYKEPPKQDSNKNETNTTGNTIDNNNEISSNTIEENTTNTNETTTNTIDNTINNEISTNTIQNTTNNNINNTTENTINKDENNTDTTKD